MNETLYAALEYQERGWPITLCPPMAKNPLGEGWGEKYPGKAWQRKKWTQREIEKAFRIRGELNVGVRFGADAGLIDIEEDAPQDRKTFAELFSGCEPAVTPTFTSKRGSHRLFAFDTRLEGLGKATIHYNGLEIKIGAQGKGSQSLLPPSISGGVRREWKVSLDICDPAQLPHEVIQKVLNSVLADASPLRHKQLLPESSGISVAPVSSVSHPLTIEEAISATLPTGPGQRHRKLFDFARHLKALPEYANAETELLKPIVKKWHELALPSIATKPFTETWIDFSNAWPKVRYAAGREPIAVICHQAMQNKQTLPFKVCEYDIPELRNLVALCRQLQLTAGKKPFFLAGRKAAELLDVPHPTIARWLNFLTKEKLLEITTLGTRHKATEYRYLGEC